MSTLQQPPVAAVARDPHWRNKVAKLAGRKPLTRTVTLADDDAADALNEAKTNVLKVRAAARARAIDSLGNDAAEWSDETRAVRVAEIMEADPEVVEAEEKVRVAAEAKKDADVEFEFRAIPGDWWEQLIGAHPPTSEQEGRGEVYNVNTFAPAIIAACSLAELPATFDAFVEAVAEALPDVMAFYPGLNNGEQSLLFQGAVQVNQGARATLGKG